MGERVGFGSGLFVCLLLSSQTGLALTTILPQPQECWDSQPLHATTPHQSILKKSHLGAQLRSACPAYTKPWLPSSAPHRTGYGDADLGRLKWEDLGFEASLGYTRRPSLQNNLNI